MHFSKLITAFVVVAATGVLAYHEESHGNELAGANQEFEGLGGGMDAAGLDSEMEDFSPVEVTSLEASTNGYCFFGRCLRRNSYRRRCPRGYRVAGFRRCGFWRNRIRALCCRHRRRWVHGTQEGDEVGAESSELQLDQLDD